MPTSKIIAFCTTVLLLIGALSSPQPAAATAGPVTPPEPAAPPPSLIATSEILGRKPVELRLDENASPFRLSPPRSLLNGTGSANPLDIQVRYLTSGQSDWWGQACMDFPAQAKPAFDYAVNIWENLLNDPNPTKVPIVIQACWTDLPNPSVLGYSGSDMTRDFPNAPEAGTYYAMSLANILSGVDQNSGIAEMSIAYNNDFLANGRFYFGTDDAPGDKLSFATIVLHEIAHGLNFSGTMKVDFFDSEEKGGWGIDGYPSVYDRLVISEAGHFLLNTSQYPNPSTALKTALTTPSVIFIGSNATDANGGGNVPLYTPTAWSPGSSYAHLHENYNYGPNGLMTYSIGDGENYFDPGPITMGLLTDLGWPFPPKNINLDNNAIPESLPTGSLVGILSTSDPNRFESFSYTFAPGGPDNNSFILTDNKLRTKSTFEYDYTTENTYSIKIRSTDRNGLYLDKGFTITITDVNTPPADITLLGTSVDENQPVNTVVGTLSAVDAETGDTHTFTLGCDGANNGSFNISGDQLRTSAAFDYEAKSTYAICIRATDGGGLWFEKPFTIDIADENESPTAITLTGTSVAENQPANDTVVGALSAADEDAGDTFTYALTCPGADNGSFHISGNQLRTASVFDFEGMSSYTICVTVSDAGGLTFDKSFTITVTDVNETPAQVLLSNDTVSANAMAGDVVGTLSALDPDAGESLTYSFAPGEVDNAEFEIAGSTLKLKNAVNRAGGETYTIAVTVTDHGGLTATATLTITVQADTFFTFLPLALK